MLPSLGNSIAHVVWQKDHSTKKNKNDGHDSSSDNDQRYAYRDEVRQEIDRIRKERQCAKDKHELFMQRQRHHLRTLKQRHVQIRNRQELPVHWYASELKKKKMSFEDNVTMVPNYILLLQAQLCRAVHTLCVDTTQLQLLERMHSALLLLTKEQEGRELNRILRTIETKTDVMMALQQTQQRHRQQHNEVVVIADNISIDDRNENDECGKLLSVLGKKKNDETVICS